MVIVKLGNLKLNTQKKATSQTGGHKLGLIESQENAFCGARTPWNSRPKLLLLRTLNERPIDTKLVKVRPILSCCTDHLPSLTLARDGLMSLLDLRTSAAGHYA